MMLPVHSPTPAIASGGRFAVESTNPTPSLCVRLAKGETIAFTTADAVVRVRACEGAIWLTEDANDHVLATGETFVCDRHRRVVLSALADAAVDVAVDVEVTRP